MNIVISGGSTIAKYLISTMSEEGHRFTIIESDQETFDNLCETMPKSVLMVLGDGCDPQILHDAGVDDADLFIALMGHDETNFVSCELAMIECEVSRSIALLNNPENQLLFKKANIEPISSTGLIAQMVNQEQLMGDVRTVISLREGDITMVETKLPSKMKHKNGILVGDLPELRYAQLIAVVRDGDFIIANDDVILNPGETVVAAVKENKEKELKAVLKLL